MAARRPQGIGTLTERPRGSGKWQWRMRLGNDPVTGQARRIVRTFDAKTPAAAEKRVRAMLAEIEATPTEGGNVTLRVLFDEWTRHIEVRKASPHTLERNARTIATVFAPLLDVPISKITVRQLDGIYGEMLGRGLAASTVRRHHAVIASAFTRAVKWDWIDENRNPTARVSLPEQPKRALVVPELPEIQAIVSGLDEMNPTYGMAAFLAAATGCRRGELCALRWTDYSDGVLDVSASLYRVAGVTGTKGTKTGVGRRVRVVGLAQGQLEAWRATCEDKAAEAGCELADDSYILASWPDGSRPVNPDSLSSAFSRTAKALGLSHVHFHSLRHFAATEMLAVGGSPKDAAEALGHASPIMTLNVYAHSTEDRQRELMEAVGRALDPGRDETPARNP